MESDEWPGDKISGEAERGALTIRSPWVADVRDAIQRALPRA